MILKCTQYNENISGVGDKPPLTSAKVLKIKKPIHTKLYVMTVVISLLHRLIILERTSSRGAIGSLNIHKYSIK